MFGQLLPRSGARIRAHSHHVQRTPPSDRSRQAETVGCCLGRRGSDARRRSRIPLPGGSEPRRVLRLIDGLFPVKQLERLTFAQIIEFREQTAPQRSAFLREVTETVRTLEGDPAQASYDRQVAAAINDLRKKMFAVQAELSSARDKLLPSATDAILYGAAGTGALSSLGTFLGGLSSAGLVGASALTIGGALAAKAAQNWVERRQLGAKSNGRCLLPPGRRSAGKIGNTGRGAGAHRPLGQRAAPIVWW